MTRRYRLRERAQAMEDTRLRIAEAAVELHGTLGPARTTISAVAARAGVQRHTVYRHYPTESELYAACSGLFGRRHPFPDIDAWAAIENPRERLGIGLDAIYRYYEGTAQMWTLVLRDREVVDAVESTLTPFTEQLDQAVKVLSSGWGARGGHRRLLSATVRHATDLATWRSLAGEGGVSRTQTVELMSALVESAAGRS